MNVNAIANTNANIIMQGDLDIGPPHQTVVRRVHTL